MNWLGRIRTLVCCGVAMSTLLVAACGSSADVSEDTTDATNASDAAQGSAGDNETGAGDTTDEDASDEDPADEDSAGGDTGDGEAADGVEALFPDVVGATAEQESDGTWTFSATLSSPYDTPERYADGWRVVGPDGTVYGERPLGHDHQFEQPFTRSQSGIEIPESITEVTVEGRDQLSGWGGATVQVTLDR